MMTQFMGFVKLESAWEIESDHIMKFVNKNKIAPHALYRKSMVFLKAPVTYQKKLYPKRVSRKMLSY